MWWRLRSGLGRSEDCPWLYTLVLALRRGAQAVDVEACRVGMRSVRVEGGQLKVNGRAIEIRGVNRHEHDARLGKYASRDTMLTDIRLMKQVPHSLLLLSSFRVVARLLLAWRVFCPRAGARVGGWCAGRSRVGCSGLGEVKWGVEGDGWVREDS
eukprot:1325908-Rhodomonas_salina.2